MTITKRRLEILNALSYGDMIWNGNGVSGTRIHPGRMVRHRNIRPETVSKMLRRHLIEKSNPHAGPAGTWYRITITGMRELARKDMVII